MAPDVPSNSFQTTLPAELHKFRYLTEQQVSELTGRALQTLRNDRFHRRGLPYHKIGRSVRYKLLDVLSVMESRRVDVEAL